MGVMVRMLRYASAVPDRLEAADQWEAEKRLVRSSARGRLARFV
jgi:hypothetical protein